MFVDWSACIGHSESCNLVKDILDTGFGISKDLSKLALAVVLSRCRLSERCRSTFWETLCRPIERGEFGLNLGKGSEQGSSHLLHSILWLLVLHWV